jgi:hypothetical protein
VIRSKIIYFVVQVAQCPENKNSLKFRVKPRALEDSVTVELEIDCDCSCEQPGSQVKSY